MYICYLMEVVLWPYAWDLAWYTNKEVPLTTPCISQKHLVFVVPQYRGREWLSLLIKGYSSCVEVNAFIYQSDDVVKYCWTGLRTCVSNNILLWTSSYSRYPWGGPPVIEVNDLHVEALMLCDVLLTMVIDCY